jgi:hypothetical protein
MDLPRTAASRLMPLCFSSFEKAELSRFTGPGMSSAHAHRHFTRHSTALATGMASAGPRFFNGCMKAASATSVELRALVRGKATPPGSGRSTPLQAHGRKRAFAMRGASVGPHFANVTRSGIGVRCFCAAPFDGIDRGVRAGTGADQRARQAAFDAHADGKLLLVFLEGKYPAAP